MGGGDDRRGLGPEHVGAETDGDKAGRNEQSPLARGGFELGPTVTRGDIAGAGFEPATFGL